MRLRLKYYFLKQFNQTSWQQETQHLLHTYPIL